MSTPNKPGQKPCLAIQINKQAEDFSCGLAQGHGGPHLDPRTATPWGDGKYPRGVRRKP